jgi:hypothetical protein
LYAIVYLQIVRILFDVICCCGFFVGFVFAGAVFLVGFVFWGGFWGFFVAVVVVGYLGITVRNASGCIWHVSYTASAMLQKTSSWIPAG